MVEEGERSCLWIRSQQHEDDLSEDEQAKTLMRCQRTCKAAGCQAGEVLECIVADKYDQAHGDPPEDLHSEQDYFCTRGHPSICSEQEQFSKENSCFSHADLLVLAEHLLRLALEASQHPEEGSDTQFDLCYSALCSLRITGKSQFVLESRLAHFMPVETCLLKVAQQAFYKAKQNLLDQDQANALTMFKEGCRQSAGQEESLPIQCLPVFLASVIDSDYNQYQRRAAIVARECTKLLTITDKIMSVTEAQDLLKSLKLGPPDKDESSSFSNENVCSLNSLLLLGGKMNGSTNTVNTAMSSSGRKSGIEDSFQDQSKTQEEEAEEQSPEPRIKLENTSKATPKSVEEEGGQLLRLIEGFSLKLIQDKKNNQEQEQSPKYSSDSGPNNRLMLSIKNKSRSSLETQPQKPSYQESRNTTPDVISLKRQPSSFQEPFRQFGFYDRSLDVRAQPLHVKIEEQIDAFGFGGDSDEDNDLFSIKPQRARAGAQIQGDTDSLTELSSATNLGSLNSDSIIYNNQDTHQSLKRKPSRKYTWNGEQDFQTTSTFVSAMQTNSAGLLSPGTPGAFPSFYQQQVMTSPVSGSSPNTHCINSGIPLSPSQSTIKQRQRGDAKNIQQLKNPQERIIEEINEDDDEDDPLYGSSMLGDSSSSRRGTGPGRQRKQNFD